MTADWLINYNHGFISRGLFGTFLINSFDRQESMLDFLSFLLITVYILIFYHISKIFNQSEQNFISLILIFSPATFLFNIYDSQGSFRKEILSILSPNFQRNVVRKNWKNNLVNGDKLNKSSINPIKKNPIEQTK